MTRSIIKFIILLVFVLVAYLLFWPLPVSPQAWSAPKNEGYVGAFTPNNALENVKVIALGDYSGPEDAVFGSDGKLYISTAEGAILTYDQNLGDIGVFAQTGGRPLGLEFGSDGVLYVADAYRGLLSISPEGEVQLLADKADDGSAILFADDVTVTKDGTVYFTDASTKFGAKEWGGTYKASFLDLVEHGSHGRVLKYDPTTRQTTTIVEGLTFANGIALTQDEQSLLVVETGTYTIHKVSIADGLVSELVSNLPGFPDNINRNADGTFWVGLVSPRPAIVDLISDKPFLRKLILRLPSFFHPEPIRYGFVFRLNEQGEILETMQDPEGNYAIITGLIEAPNGDVFLTSLTEPDLGILEK